MYIKFIILTTSTFDKEIEKLARSDKSLRNKIQRASAKLAVDPFQGQRVQGANLEQRRILVGDSHRLFYDIDGDNVVLLHLKKKDKHTYR